MTPGHLLRLIRSVVPPMHPAGRPFVAGGVLAGLLLRRLSRRSTPLSLAMVGWLAWFFREPRRVAPSRAGVAVAPADGEVHLVDHAPPPPELGLDPAPRPRVSVFLSVFDVHVQRSPVDGQVAAVEYRPGKFLSADLDKASQDNERNTVLLRDGADREVIVVQIAGLVARRIVCSVRPGDPVRRGQTVGLIRFGSRVDLYLPTGSRPLVEPGQRAIGGETVLAELPGADGDSHGDRDGDGDGSAAHGAGGVR
jgi:phosphatidylserine decarboxylase